MYREGNYSKMEKLHFQVTSSYSGDMGPFVKFVRNCKISRSTTKEAEKLGLMKKISKQAYWFYLESEQQGVPWGSICLSEVS